MSEKMTKTKQSDALTQTQEAQLEQYLPVPDRLYFTISEAAELCLVQPHVLRYWERQFKDLSPVKRRGRRYFTSKDILYVRQIRELLYAKNFTIEGACAQLEQHSTSDMVLPRQMKDIVALAVDRLERVLSILNPSSEGTVKIFD